MGGFSALYELGRDLFDGWTNPVGTGVTGSFLALLFLISGITKLRRPALAAMAMVDFGVVRRVRPELGQAVGIGELVLAGALVVAPGPAGVISAAVLWLFAVMIGRALWNGDSFPCFCFGETDHLLSATTLLRTALLATAAIVLAMSAPFNLVAFGGEWWLQLVVAAAALALIVLGSRISALLRWNSDPFGVEVEEVP